MPTVAAPDTMFITLDPTGVAGLPEIVQITVHTAAATVCTIVRAQQATVARQHLLNTIWRHSSTKSDFDELPFRKLTTTGDILYASAANTTGRLAVGATDAVLTTIAGIPSWQVPYQKHRVSATKNTTQFIPDITATAVTFPDAEDYDTDAYHDVASLTSRITIPVGLGGVYRFGYSVYVGPAAGGTAQAWLQSSAQASARLGWGSVYIVNLADDGVITGSSDIVIAAGAYVEVFVYQKSGGGRNVGIVGVPMHFWATYAGPS